MSDNPHMNTAKLYAQNFYYHERSVQFVLIN